jgi:hypothetical protein
MAGEIFQVANITDYFIGEKVRGSQGIKWPKTHFGVVALLGEVPRDGSVTFDVDAAMAELGWQRIPATTPATSREEVSTQGHAASASASEAK